MPVPYRDATVLAPGSALSGRVSGQELDVLGAFDGELELSGRVRLAAGSKVKARVRADLVEIEGDFEGEVRAKTLRVGEGAHARGLFFADRIAVVEGALLEGGVNPSEPLVDAGDEMSSSGVGVDEVIPAKPGREPTAVI
jgi:cytoskeletal protein CcmA (bactofilin family)